MGEGVNKVSVEISLAYSCIFIHLELNTGICVIFTRYADIKAHASYTVEYQFCINTKVSLNK